MENKVINLLPRSWNSLAHHVNHLVEHRLFLFYGVVVTASQLSV